MKTAYSLLATTALLAATLPRSAPAQIAGYPTDSPLIMGNVNVCPAGQTTPAPCSQKLAMIFTFTTGGKLSTPVVVTQGALNKDFTDAGTGTCNTNGTSHVYLALDQCTVDVLFTPQHPGLRTGAVVLHDTTVTGKEVATGFVNGIGQGPQAVFFGFTSTLQNVAGGNLNVTALAVDPNGNIFVGGISGLNEFTASNGYTPIPLLPSVDVTGVALDGRGNVWVSAFYGVFEILAAGGYQTIYSFGTSGNVNATGIAVDGSGNAFFLDSDINGPPMGSLRELVPSGSSATIKTLGTKHDYYPGSLAMDASGNIFVAGADAGNVLEVTAASGYATVKTLISPPYVRGSIAVDAAGDLFVAEGRNPWTVTEYFAADGYTKQSTLGFVNTAGFGLSGAVALDSNGNLYAGRGSIVQFIEKVNLGRPPALAFAPSTADSISPDSPQTVTIGNSGNQDLKINLSYPTDFPEAPGVSTDCAATVTLAAGDGCTLSVNFSPLAASLDAFVTPLSESVSLTDNTLNGSAVDESIETNGTGTFGPLIISPQPGIQLQGEHQTFKWASYLPAPYRFRIGNAYRGSDIYDTGATSATSASVAVPVNGNALPIYVTLSYKYQGEWHATEFTYLSPQFAIPAVIQTPAPFSTLNGSTVTFTWSAGDATKLRFRVGSTSGGGDIYDSGLTVQTSATVTNLPANGSTVYATLSYYLDQNGGNWYTAHCSNYKPWECTYISK